MALGAAPSPRRLAHPRAAWRAQVAFVVVIVLVLVFDALADATIRSVLLGDDFSITMDKILKTAGKTQPM